MKKIHAFYIIALLVLTAIIVLLLIRNESSVQENRNTSLEQGTLTLRIEGRGDDVESPPIEETCKEKMNAYLGKAIDLERETEIGQQTTGCSLMESRAGYSETECGRPMALGGCSICKIRCY